MTRASGLRRTAVLGLALALTGVAVLPTTGGAAAAPRVFVFSGEGNRLNVYDHATGKKQTLIWAATDPKTTDGREHKDINAQICFRQYKGKTYFIAGEDTAQGGEEGDPGWGWFELRGRDLGSFRTVQRGKIVPTYGNAADNPENYGCGFLDDGRLLTGDVGDQLPLAGANGQLIMWFPDRTGGFGNGFKTSRNGVPLASKLSYCKIDNTIATAGGMWVDNRDPRTAADDVVYIASNRPAQTPLDEWGIFKYTGIGGVRGCKDSQTPLIDVAGSGVKKELFIQAGASLTPSAVIPFDKDTVLVSSVFDANIGQYGREDGSFQRHVVGTPGRPAPISLPIGQITFPLPGGSGTPFGMGMAPDRTLYYADIGVILQGPNRDGRVMRVRFDANGDPGTPEVVDTGLAFPDGIGILVIR